MKAFFVVIVISISKKIMPEVVFPKSFQISNCRKRSTKRSGKLEF